jgi:hypothetical protein
MTPRKPKPGSDGEWLIDINLAYTRGELREILRRYGYEGTEAQVQVLAREFDHAYSGALNFAAGESYQGIEGMALRGAIAEGHLPLTASGRTLLYAASDEPRNEAGLALAPMPDWRAT